FGTSADRRIPLEPGRNASEAGSVDSRTTCVSLPRYWSANSRPRQEPTASPSGSTWAVIRNSRPDSKNGSKPSNAGSFIGRLLDLAEELVDARAGLDRMVHLEMEMRNDPELQPGRQKAPEVRRGALQRLE